MKKVRQSILAEITEVKAMLKGIPVGQALLKQGMQARLADLQDKLGAFPPETTRRAEVELTFRGKPVHHSEGVEADFAGKALEKYNKAISLITANHRVNLRGSGPIPGRNQPRLFVCNRAVGSFGFLLRELEVEGKEEEKETFMEGQFRSSATYQAVNQMAAVLKASQSSDDDLAEIAAEMDRRTLHAIRDFLTVVADSEACAQHRIAGKDLVSFPDVGSVRGAAERLSDENIDESEVEVFGTLDGVIRSRRWFELIGEGNEGLITGKVDQSFDDQMIVDLKQAIDSRIKAILHVTMVGKQKTAKRYRLLSWEKTAYGQQGKIDLGTEK